MSIVFEYFYTYSLSCFQNSGFAVDNARTPVVIEIGLSFAELTAWPLTLNFEWKPLINSSTQLKVRFCRC